MEYFNNIVTKSMQPISSEERFFEGYLTVQMKDKQGEITIVDELYKVLPVWMDRGAPISDTHSNRIVGKGINYSKTVYKSEDGTEYPAIKITGKIHKNYELDNDIWTKIKNGEYKGLSFGGATRTDRTPIVMKDGSIAYALKDLEHYEVAVCRDPAVPLALITDYNPIAKAIADHTEDRDGKMLIKCSKFGCFVEKTEEEKDYKPKFGIQRCDQCDRAFEFPYELSDHKSKDHKAKSMDIEKDAKEEEKVIEEEKKEKEKEAGNVEKGVGNITSTKKPEEDKTVQNEILAPLEADKKVKKAKQHVDFSDHEKYPTFQSKKEALQNQGYSKESAGNIVGAALRGKALLVKSNLARLKISTDSLKQ